MPFIKTRLKAAAPAAPASIALLLANLAAGSVDERRAAAQALGRHPESVPSLVDALAQEGEQPVRSALLDALATIGTEESVAALADCLRSEDAWLRNSAIEVLRGLPAQVAPVMAHLLVDWNRDVRILAVSILDTLRHERVEEWLLQLIDADCDMNVCGAALDVLAEVASGAALQPVRRLLARWPGEPYIEFAGRLVLDRVAQPACA